MNKNERKKQTKEKSNKETQKDRKIERNTTDRKKEIQK